MMTEQEYLKNRVNNQIDWYSKRSRLNKNSHRILRTVEIILGALIPLLSGYIGDITELKITVGILGVIVVSIAGIISLFRFQENWIQYRATAERLKNEKMFFETRTGIYFGIEHPFQFFVSNIEAIISTETQAWQQRIIPEETTTS